MALERTAMLVAAALGGTKRPIERRVSIPGYLSS
ncbi:hypothetical protein SAMN04489841_0259 [Natrinema salaciae]|uniref:Uncharacterized protein n=1 Tax=Natrinema salaciae TaxID=1186196 RepID=A0A1H8ZU01_9EURY|nr:hypothetical protein SAMN04489841_0259 [Natrinema salaciae]